MTVNFKKLHKDSTGGNIVLGVLPKDLATPTPTPSPSNTPTPTPTATNAISSGLSVSLNISNYSSGSTTWTNSLNNGNNGSLVNGPTSISGAIQFDGSNDYMTFTSGILLKPSTTQPITLQAWIYPTSQRNTGLFGKLSNQNSYDGYIFGFQSGITNSTTNGTLIDRRINGTNARLIANNEWQMVTYIAVINNNSGSTQAYVNTTQVLAGAHGSDGYDEFNYLRIGQGYHGDLAIAYTGRIAEFNYYNRALSLNEITDNYNNTKGKYGL